MEDAVLKNAVGYGRVADGGPPCNFLFDIRGVYG